MSNGKLLIVDDERKMCIVLKAAFENIGLQVTTANSGEAALAALEMDTFDVILSDIKMPGISGLELLEKVKTTNPETKMLLMTAYADTKTAVEAMKLGAFDYVIKPFEIDELRHKVSNVLEMQELKQENIVLRKKLHNKFSLDNMVGKSGPMVQVYKLVEKVAPSDATVLIRGESGTGKELVAQAIHHHSQRRDKKFIAVNCSALPETLLESELFGYEKGAFTGADKQKPGLFEQAGNGTIFLDEIGDMTPATQVKLLRVLQSREIIRLGGTESIKINARTLAATNRNLEEMVKDKSFREDLYYRINVFPITIPPLRDRKTDIPQLVEHFITQQGGDSSRMDPVVNKLLMDFYWPGNVRELENIIERAMIMSGGGSISVDDLPPYIRGEGEIPIDKDVAEDDMMTLDEMEIRMIRRALTRAAGNKTKAADMLGITRRQLYSKMERLMPGVD